MENGKPFIFIHPLSEALQKLLEEYKGKAEAENLEIYELENVAEVTQVLPTLGQSLTITSSPKKCAQILQSSKKIIKKNNLKFILLSPKQLPWKVQQKLTKIGLTECAVEPLPQRTLSYKVNLHLRAIKVTTKQEDDPTKTFSADGDNQFNNMDEQNIEKGLKKEENELNAEDLYGKEMPKPKSALEEMNEELIGEAGEVSDDPKIAPVDDLKAMMNEGLSLDMDDELPNLNDGGPLDAGAMNDTGMPEYADEDPDALMNELKGMREELGGNLQGDANLKEELMKDLAGKSNFKEEDQRGNYEGEGKTADQLKDLAGKSNFKEDDQGGNYDGEGKAADELKDLAGKNNFKEDDHGGNYEGENKSADNLNNLEEKNKSEPDKQAGNLAGKTKEGANKEPGNLAGKNKFQEQKKGNLEGDQKESAEKKPGNLAGKTKEGAEQQPGNLGGKTKEGAERQASNLDGKTQQAAERKNDLDGKGQKADEIEGYYGKKKKKDEEQSEHEESEKPAALSLDADKKKKETESWQEDAKKGMSGKGQKADEIEGHYGRKKDKQQSDEERDEVEQDGTLSLDADKKKKETEGWREDAKKGMSGKGEFKADEIEGYYGKKKEKAEDEQQKDKTKADSLDEDKYRKKEKGYEFESGPGKKKEAPTMEAEDPKKKDDEEAGFESLFSKSGSEIKYAKPKDWGEQTIDYRKLNDEFGGITTDREGQDGEGMGIKDGVPVPEKIQNKDGGGIESVEIPIVEAVPKGLDDLVSVLEMYLGKKSPSIILDQIAELVVEKEAEWCLFCKSDGNKLDLSSYAGLDPIKASQKVNENSSTWLNQGLPEWSDPKFQADENTFFFPYFDGVTPLGLFVAHFSKKMEEEQSKAFEVIVEGARGVFLDSHIKVVEEQPKKPGVLGKLFGKKAG